MPRQGLSKESVVQAAVDLIEEKGVSQFSMGKLAQRLKIKPASLYNHVESIDKLMKLVKEEAIYQLVQLENQAIAGKKKNEALFALAEAYRSFARNHYQLYQVIMAFPKENDLVLKQEAGEIISPFLKVLADYGLTENQQFHWQRVLRAMMSGFAFHEQAGGFSYFPIDQDESFYIAMQCIANGLCQTGGEKR
ncbi:TetR/AcrR family transcriptional regulator [uncultured Traorella sp.]|uniref:TetR/AcrR family transcriptional regulator n=1 Tax=uncultured Traorella sp. TaxID=1929048 RepID=UPI0025D13A7D|nr:TetR/AcrR family transcriptional regulator [uncultured Traorella sp.]